MASGRAPLRLPRQSAWAVPEAALVEPSRRDRVRGWITRSGTEAASLAPADASGLAWSALGLKVSHPGRPHRLTLTVNGGHPAALGVALIDSPSSIHRAGTTPVLVGGGAAGAGPGASGGIDGRTARARVVLDACASGPPILESGPAATFSWLVWPEDPDPVLVLVNRDPEARVQLGTLTLTELADLPAGPALVEPAPEARRSLGLYLAGPGALDRFGSGRIGDRERERSQDRAEPGDPLALARNLARYAAWCGVSEVVLSEHLADRAHRRALDGQAGEDCLGPDRLDLMLQVLGRHGCMAWVELELRRRVRPAGLASRQFARSAGPGTGPGRSTGPRRRSDPGLSSSEPRGRGGPETTGGPVDRPPSQPAGLAGVLIRLGPGPTLLGGPDTGFDDATFTRFVRETFDRETAQTIPGVGSASRAPTGSPPVPGSSPARAGCPG